MYRHFFGCAFGNISIGAVLLLAQRSKYYVTCWNTGRICFTSHWTYISKMILQN